MRLSGPSRRTRRHFVRDRSFEVVLSGRIALSRSGLALQSAVKALGRRARFALRAKHRGMCPICEAEAAFAFDGDNPRETPLCLACGSVPRQRALVSQLGKLCGLGDAAVHESSPSLCTYRFFRRNCPNYLASYYFPNLSAGGSVGQFRCVDLHDQALPSSSFDLVVTQDVLEHVTEPMRALREIQRTLKPGGAHVFTVPRRNRAPTTPRARLESGQLKLLTEAVYHCDPVLRSGALVVTDWGCDLEELLASEGIPCTVQLVRDESLGIPRPIEVFMTSVDLGSG